MNSYAIQPKDLGPPKIILRDDGLYIPINNDNRDYVQFLEDWKAGAEVLNADGSPAPYSDAAVRALGLEPV